MTDTHMKKEQTRTDRFLLNVTMSAVLQVVTVITGFISPKLMLSNFGSEINGLTSSVSQFIVYIGLVEAGLANATVFALYKPLANGDTRRRDRVVSSARVAYRNIGLIFTGLACLLAAFYPLIGKTSVLNYWQTSFLVFILSMNGAVNFFVMAKYRTLLTADQCSYCISLASSIQYVLYLAIMYFAIRCGLRYGSEVVIIRALGVLSIFVSAILLSVIVKVKYGNINFYAKPDMRLLGKRYDAMFVQILGGVIKSTPTVILTTIRSLTVVSIFSVFNMIAGSITTCIDIFTSGLCASFGTIQASGDKKLLRNSTEQFRTVIDMIITVLYAVMLVTLLPFIALYTRNLPDASIYYQPAFSVLITLNGLTEAAGAPFGMLVFSFGRFKEMRKYTLTQALIIVIAGAAFTVLWGLDGVMISMILSNLFMLIAMLYFTQRHLIRISVKKEAFRISRMFLIPVAAYSISRAIGYAPGSYRGWILYAVITTAAIAAVTFGVNALFEKRIFRDIKARIRYFVTTKLGEKKLQ
jgi:hypothetical protein